MDPTCEFCKIVAGEADARVVNATEHTVAFFPLKPAVLGHTLVVPTVHVPDIFALSEPIAAAVGQAVLAGAHAIKRALSPDGLNIINSAGAAASQTIFHLHVHLVPRWTDDRVGNIWPPSEPWPEEITDDVADAVRVAWGE
jgi:histidine triad (HIT) family protein